MASLIQRGERHCVVYHYMDENNQRKQRWESFKTLAEAKKRKKEIEFQQEVGTLVVPKCRYMRELLDEYVALYGKNNWALSTYQGNTALINNYIIPIIGDMKISDINTRVIEKYYQRLLTTEAVPTAVFGRKVEKKKVKLITAQTIHEINKVLRSCFTQAVKWEVMEKNPCVNATLPKAEHKNREIWTAETLFKATELCEDKRLKLAINIAFACSLRIGEMLGLTWDSMDITPESIANGTTYIYIDKEIQRVTRDALKSLDGKDVITVYPSTSSQTTTIQIMKTPKTKSSVRKIYLPSTVARMLCEWKEEQDVTRELLGSEYQDYNLVFTSPFGMPLESSTIRNAMKQLIKEHNLPEVVFHSLRHSSITYKLKLNGGDIKSVQGDSGHSQAQMVTDQYSHILDEDRAHNAQLFEDAFYKGKEVVKPKQKEASSNVDPEVVSKLLQNPELVALLQALTNK